MPANHRTRARLAASRLLLAACALWLGSAVVPPPRAQEGQLAPADAPAQEAPTAEPPADAPVAKPKPKPRPRAAKPKPAEVKPADVRPADAKPADAKPAEPEPKPAQDGTVLEPSAAVAPAVWPNGARSVSEAYGDWTMNCTREGERTDCVVIQSQGDRRTGKRQFSIELRTPKDGRAEGLILMPFGLQIEPGVTFKLDDRALGKGAPYSYCVSDGCLVPISLPTLATDTMKTAQNMTVTGARPDGKDPAVITVPLAGFAAAFARAAAFAS